MGEYEPTLKEYTLGFYIQPFHWSIAKTYFAGYFAVHLGPITLSVSWMTK